MIRQNCKEVESVGSWHSSSQDDEVKALRVQLQKLERSLQERDDTIEELRRRNHHIIEAEMMDQRMIHPLIQGN